MLRDKFFSKSNLIISFFGLGNIKYAPGTFGSIGGVILYYLMLLASNRIFLQSNLYNIYKPENVKMLLIIFSLITIMLFILGTFVSDSYSKRHNIQDPKEVVIDEVVGQMITLISHSFIIIPAFFEKGIFTASILVFCSFTLFRIFDIIKPWPIEYFDKNCKGGFGIMIDDVVAAIIASIVGYALFFIYLDLIKA